MTIADDVLVAAKAIAREQDKTVGEVISDLARRALRKPSGRRERNGVPLLPVQKGHPVVTLEIVNALRDEAS